MGHIDSADIHATFADVGEQDLVKEDIAKTHRQEHVRRDQTEGHDTGDQAPVDFQLGQHIQQRRNQQRDKSDVDRQNILRRNRHHQQQGDQQPLDPIATHGLLLVDHAQRFVGHGMGQSRLGNGYRESAQHRVGQRNLSTTTQPAIKRTERRLNTQPADKATHKGTHNQCDNHMHTGQTEHQHDADRGNYCIHHYNLIARTTIKTP